MRTAIRTDLYTLVGVLLCAAAWAWWSMRPAEKGAVELELLTSASSNVDFTVFLDTTGNGFNEDLKRTGRVGADGRCTVQLPAAAQYHGMRIDPGEGKAPVVLTGLRITTAHSSFSFGSTELAGALRPAHDIDSTRSAVRPEGWSLAFNGPDPYLVASDDLNARITAAMRSKASTLTTLLKALLTALLGLLLFHIIRSFVKVARSTGRNANERPSRTSLVLVGLATVLIGLVTHLVMKRIVHTTQDLVIEVVGTFPKQDRGQLHYAARPGGFDARHMTLGAMRGGRDRTTLRFVIPGDSAVRYLRFDPGERQDTIWLDSIRVRVGDAEHSWSGGALWKAIKGENQVRSMKREGARIRCILAGDDPYFILPEDLGTLLANLHRKASAGPLPPAFAAVAMIFFLLGSAPGLARRIDRDGARPRDLALATGFVLLIALPQLATLTGTDPQLRNTEKRELAKAPAMTDIPGFPAAFTTYFEENFGLRRLLFRWNALFHLRVLGESPLPDRLITGKDGWLFQCNEQVLGAYRGVPLFTPEKLEAIRLRYEARQRWLAARGIRYYILIPPLSGNLNREMLPDRIRRTSESSWVDEVKAYFDRYSTVPVIDPAPALRVAKRKAPVYFTTDMHWNPYGAYFGYQALMERVRVDDPRIPPPIPIDSLVFRNDTNHMADLSEMLALADVLPRVEPIMSPVKPFKASFTHTPALPGAQFFLRGPRVFAQPDTTLPKLLIFHDSFGLYMEPLLNEHFSQATYVWSGLFIPDVVDVVKPDVVVQEFLEMFVVNMSGDTLRVPAP